MIRYFFVTLIIISSCVISFSQEKKESSQKKEIPQIVRLALPSYPISGFAIYAEEKIVVNLKVNSNGEIVSTQLKAKFPPFKTLIEKNLKEWKFEESDEKIREATINFEFILLPSDSESDVSSVFELPNTIKIYEKKRKILDSTSH